MKNLIQIFSLAFLLITSFRCSAQNSKLTEGAAAPDFSLQSDENKKISLSDYKGKSNVVVYFYPKDKTSGCTRQACGIRDHYDAFKKLNTVVIGISTDDVASHQSFKKEEKLNFMLLADVDKKVSELYSGLNNFGMSKRVSFIIDKNGIIRKIFTNVDVNTHYQDLIDEIKKIK